MKRPILWLLPKGAHFILPSYSLVSALWLQFLPHYGGVWETHTVRYMSISQSFSKLIARIQPTPSEVNSAKQHLTVIKTRLETVFDLSSCRAMGSFNRDTSIHGFSDTDLFAVFRKAQFTWGGNIISSTRVLENIRQELLARYPNTPLGRDGMAITIKFSSGQIVDVVPALFDSMFKERWPIYLIPDGVCGKVFVRTRMGTRLNPHKNERGYPCSGRYGLYAGVH